jgi:hypothetical protein
MPYTTCKLLCIARIGGGIAQSIKFDPADHATDLLQGLDTAVLALHRLPRKVRIDHASIEPSYAECHATLAPIIQNIGNGLYDLSATPIKSGHIFSGGVWTQSKGFAFQLLENSTAKSRNLPAKNTANANTMLTLDYLVQVSW